MEDLPETLAHGRPCPAWSYQRRRYPMQCQQGVFEAITKQWEAVWRFRAKPLSLNVGRDNESAGVEVGGEGLNYFVDCLGVESVDRLIVAGAAPRR